MTAFAAELDDLLEPTNYLGSADLLVDRALEPYEREQHEGSRM